MNLNALPRQYKIIVSALGVMTFITGFYLSAFNSFGYQSNNESIGITLMILSILLYPIFWPDDLLSIKLKVHFSVKLLIIILIGFGIVLSLILTVLYVKETYLKIELNKYGVKTTAIVTGFEYEYIRSDKIEYATIQYKTGGHTITQRIKNYSSTYYINQQLPIYFSEINPEMFQIIEK
ncbi:MAG: hypothetical protein MUF39_03755 [Cyclobacteriaceae bacterium]|jgi:hypothetical protein|nr:hypothetical protein [Cyclobacteriaceae bacterium]